MKKFTLTIISVLLLITLVKAQTCDDLFDISCTDCHIVLLEQACKCCNYPKGEDSYRSWFDNEVIGFKTVGENKFLRFYSGNQPGSWMVKQVDLCDNGKLPTYSEVKDILQLKDMPTGIVEVDVPDGTPMYEGRIFGSTRPDCRQFCLQTRIDVSCYLVISGDSLCPSINPTIQIKN